LVTILLSISLTAQLAPNLVDYQGRLLESTGEPVDTMVSLEFGIYEDSLNGSLLWSETHNAIEVSDGLFQVQLGSHNPLPEELFNEENRWLGISVNSDSEMSPRTRIASAPYSLRSNFALEAANAPADGDWVVNGENLYTEPTGDVGIGKTDPSHKLHISSSSSSYGMLMLENSNTGDNEVTMSFKEGSDASGDDIWIQGVGGWDNTNDFIVGKAGVKFLIEPDGQIGIGTTAPSNETKLHINTTTDNFGLLIDAENTSGTEIGLHAATSKYSSLAKNAYFNSGAWHRFDTNYGAFLQEIQPDGKTLFRTVAAGTNHISWNNALTILNDGKIGVNNTNPDYDLDVNGGIRAVSSATSLYGKGIMGVRGEATLTYGVYGSGIIGVYGEADYSIHANAIAGYFDGKVGVGTSTPDEMLEVTGTVKCDVLKLSGGSDIAEPFNVNGDDIKKGMILSIDSHNPGQLRISDKAYDKCVAGIVSGAGGINAGMVMGQKGSVADGNVPVALTGRVYCYADASLHKIKPGDLLTTSDMPGYAMKVSNHQKAQGAIIGKAMSSLESGQGLVLVLVTLQ